MRLRLNAEVCIVPPYLGCQYAVAFSGRFLGLYGSLLSQ